MPAPQITVPALIILPPTIAPSASMFSTGWPSITVTPSFSSARLRVVGERLRKARQQPRPGFDQEDARLPRIDVPEVARQRMPGELGDRARHLDAGRPAADHDDRHQPVVLGLVRGAVGALERGQQLVRMQRASSRLRGPWRAPPIRDARSTSSRSRWRPRACRRTDRSCARRAACARCVSIARDIAEHDVDIPVAAEDAADRPGDIGRRQRRGRDLIEQRHEQVIVGRSTTVTRAGALPSALAQARPPKPAPTMTMCGC